MLKEIIICIVIVITILFGNNSTQNYTKETVDELSNQLVSLREKVIQEQPIEEIQKEVGEIYKNWKEKHDILAYFIEHDELEKVETGLTEMKSYIETNEYQDVVSELDRSAFLLKHIEDKYDFNLQNIF